MRPAASRARGIRHGLAALLALLWFMGAATGPGIGAEFGRDPRRDVEEREREQRGRTGNEARRSEFERNLDRDYRNHLEHLDADHYDAYRRERNGESLGVNPRTGASWDHITEVRDAQRGVENAIAATRARLSDPRIGHEERERLQAKLGEMSNTLEESKRMTGQTLEERRALDDVARSRNLVPADGK